MMIFKIKGIIYVVIKRVLEILEGVEVDVGRWERTVEEGFSDGRRSILIGRKRKRRFKEIN